MLFKRREKPRHWDRFRLWVWPRTSWRRSFLYYAKRVLRLTGTPHAIALGTAAGVFCSMTPFVGFHLLMTFALTWVLGGNMIAGAIGTVVGNPLTFPLIWASTYEVGHLILEGNSGSAPARLGHELTHKSFEQIVPLLKPMLVGAAPLGLLLGSLAYLVVYKAVSTYQVARRQRLGSRSAPGRIAESGQKT